VARRVAGTGPQTSPAERAAVWKDFLAASERAEQAVRDFTGMVPVAPSTEPMVVGRGAWIDANIDVFQDIAGDVIERLPKASGRRITSTILGAQLGSVLGWLSKRVLGQYDLFSGKSQLLYVGPNVIEFERRFGLTPEGFRLWIALHEVTHRVQFGAVPWLAGHVRGFIDRGLEQVELDASVVGRIMERIGELAPGGPSAWRELNIVELVTTPEQREMLTEVRALMSVVEGHASWVMNGAGEGVVPELERMRQAAAHRRESARLGIIPRALGISMKLQQYADGEAFFEQVEAEAGRAATNIAWRDPESLPTFEELSDVPAWLARVGA
jgi:coenzyme F420 biosynthesis associated uncharacterized protein